MAKRDIKDIFEMVAGSFFVLLALLVFINFDFLITLIMAFCVIGSLLIGFIYSFKEGDINLSLLLGIILSPFSLLILFIVLFFMMNLFLGPIVGIIVFAMIYGMIIGILPLIWLIMGIILLSQGFNVLERAEVKR